MINREEAEAFFNNMERDTKQEIKRQNAFVRSLERALFTTCFKCYPEYKINRDYIVSRIKDEAHEAVISINDDLDMLIHSGLDESFNTPEKFTLDYKDKEEETEELFKRSINLKYMCFEKVKEKINKYYPEIVNLKGYEILYLNYSAYCCILNFQEAFIYVTEYEE